MFSSKDGGTGKVYSSDWKEIDGYWYNGAVEFGVKVSLEREKHIIWALRYQIKKQNGRSSK